MIESHIGKLGECDESLSLIAADMRQLQDELDRFRSDAEELARLLSERETTLREKDLALSKLEEERAVLKRKADRYVARLAEAEDRGERRAASSRGREHLPEDRVESEATITETQIAGHVCVISLPSGYTLSESEEPCPRPGEIIEIGGGRFLVIRVGPPPLPGDIRPCAFLMPFGS